MHGNWYGPMILGLAVSPLSSQVTRSQVEKIFLSFHFQSSRAFISKHADADRATHRVGQERRPQVYESATETSPSAELWRLEPL